MGQPTLTNGGRRNCASGGSEFLLAENQNSEQDQPGEAHGVPEPRGRVDCDLAGFNALEESERGDAKDKREHADDKMGGVQAGDEVKEVAGRRSPAGEGESLRRELAPGGDLAGEKHQPQNKRCAEPGQSAAKGRFSQAQPFLENIELAEDVLAGTLHGERAEEEGRGIEEEDGRQQNWMPVADLLKGSWIHARAGLARVEKRDKTDEEHHVAGEGAEDEGADAVQGLARAAARTSPIVVASAATTPGGSACDGRLASGTGGFALDLGRDGSEDRGHGEPCEDEFTSPFSWTHRKSEEVPEAREKRIRSRPALKPAQEPYLGRSFGGKRVEDLYAEAGEVLDVPGDNDHAVDVRGCGDHGISAQIVGLASHQSRPLAKHWAIHR